MAYSKQTWDTTSYVNPTRMNHIEQGIESVEQEIPEIADNLTTDDSTKALSAKQGKVLNEKIEGIVFKSLLTNAPVNSTGTEVEGNLSESIGNFDFALIVFAGVNGAQFATITIPCEYVGRTFYGDIVQASNVYSHGEVKVNSNKVYVKANSYAGWSGFAVLRVYGIKL